MSEAAEISTPATSPPRPRPCWSPIQLDRPGRGAHRQGRFHERLPHRSPGLVLTGPTVAIPRGGGRSPCLGGDLACRSSSWVRTQVIDALWIVFHDARRVAGRILGPGRCRRPGGKGRRRLRSGQGRDHGPQAGQGSVRPRGSLRAAGSDGAHGRHGRADGPAARGPEGQEADRRIRGHRQVDRPPAGDHRPDDQEERKKPDITAGFPRKWRIAAGAGVDVAEVNRLLKQHRQMQDAFKMMAKGGGKGFARMAGMMGLGLPAAGGMAPAGMASPGGQGQSRPGGPAHLRSLARSAAAPPFTLPFRQTP